MIAVRRRQEQKVLFASLPLFYERLPNSLRDRVYVAAFPSASYKRREESLMRDNSSTLADRKGMVSGQI